MNIILLGSPGVGKGTYAEILSKQLDIPHISTGAIFREEIEKGTELGILSASLINKGNLVPDEITNEITLKRLERPDCKAGFILDGYPRTIAQAEFLQRSITIERVLYFRASQETILRRLGGRQTCPMCERIYHKTNIPARVVGKCDDDGTTLIVREDQTSEAIKTRLAVYEKLTKPLLDFYKHIVQEIDSNPEISTHREKILTAINRALGLQLR